MTDLLTPPATAIVQRPGYAPLTNMTLAIQTLYECMEEPADSTTRLGILYGNSGVGKTVASAFAAARTGAAYVAAKSLWTQLPLLRALAEELGIMRPARTAAELLDQIIEELNRAPRPLIVDEMDRLVMKKTVEIIRDIHDATPIPIMMIGEENLPAKLKEWDRFDNRVLVATPAQPASTEDVLLLRDHYGLGGVIADDLAIHIAERCHGVIRRIVSNLKKAGRTAATEGADRIDRAWWGNRPIRTGDVPARRSMGQ